MTRRRALARVVIVLVATAASLAGNEYILRKMGFTPSPIGGNPYFHPHSRWRWAEPDPDTGWRNKPGVVISAEPGNVRMTFWDDGRRATRSDRAIPPLPQMVILGCSATQGYGIVDDETFAWRVAALAPGWDAENFGTGGYGAYQSLLTLRRIFASSPQAYEPKLVVYGFADFHALRDVATHGWVLGFTNANGEYFAPPHVVPVDGRLEEHPLRVFPMFFLESESALVALAKVVWLRVLFFERERYEEEVTRILLTEMNDLAIKHGARFLVLGLTPATPAVEALVRSGTIEFADCPEFDPGLDLSDASFRVGGIGHPNGKAHASWARCLANWVNTHQQALLGSRSLTAPGD